MRAGEIVLLRLPQPDLSPGKLRPVTRGMAFVSGHLLSTWYKDCHAAPH